MEPPIVVPPARTLLWVWPKYAMERGIDPAAAPKGESAVAGSSSQARLATSQRKNEEREVAGQWLLCSKAHPARRVGFVSNVDREGYRRVCFCCARPVLTGLSAMTPRPSQRCMPSSPL